jgi:hypothetical protein
MTTPGGKTGYCFVTRRVRPIGARTLRPGDSIDWVSVAHALTAPAAFVLTVGGDFQLKAREVKPGGVWAIVFPFGFPVFAARHTSLRLGSAAPDLEITLRGETWTDRDTASMREDTPFGVLCGTGEYFIGIRGMVAPLDESPEHHHDGPAAPGSGTETQAAPPAFDSGRVTS